VGIGHWGLGIGDWALRPLPNPHSPIPNPQSPIPILYKLNMKNKIYIIFEIKYKKYFTLNKLKKKHIKMGGMMEEMCCINNQDVINN